MFVVLMCVDAQRESCLPLLMLRDLFCQRIVGAFGATRVKGAGWQSRKYCTCDMLYLELCCRIRVGLACLRAAAR